MTAAVSTRATPNAPRPDCSVPVTRRARVGVVFRYVDGSREVTRPLSGAPSVVFEDQPPVIAPHTAGGHRGNAGLYYAASLRAHVQYPSWLARDEAMALDYDRDVRRYAASPFRLTWPGPSDRAHVPMFFVRRTDGSAVVVDCRRRTQPAARPDTDTDTDTDGAHTDRTRVPSESSELQDIYSSIGWSYRVVGGQDQVWMTNLQWLAGYRHPRFDVSVVATRLLQRFASPTPLMPGAREVGNPIGVLPVLYHLLWRQRLSADLTAVLDGSSLVAASWR